MHANTAVHSHQAQYAAEIQRHEQDMAVAAQETAALTARLHQLGVEREHERQVVQEHLQQARIHTEQYAHQVANDANAFSAALRNEYEAKLSAMAREIEILRNRQANVTFAEGPEPIQSASTIRNESMGVPPQYEDNHGLPGHNGGALIRSGNLATNTLLSGFSAPIAPTYKGTMTDARRAFAREYMEYVRAVSAVSEST
ncbi:unnamed protein product, partial [Aphanomyces euteiches]